MQDRDEEVAVAGRRLQEGLVDEVRAGLQLLADQVEHLVDHVTRGEHLTVDLDTVPGLHDLLLYTNLRERHSWPPRCQQPTEPEALGSPASSSSKWSNTDGSPGVRALVTGILPGAVAPSCPVVATLIATTREPGRHFRAPGREVRA